MQFRFIYAALAWAALSASAAFCQTFTYQGQLRDGGAPANGSYNMTFRLFSVPTGGTALSAVGPTSVPVTNGLFSQNLNFGTLWDGSDRWLEIQVGATVLMPRIKINPTPYAAYSLRPWQTVGGGIAYNDGFVGVGTLAPMHRLHIESGAGIAALLSHHTASSGIADGIRGLTDSSSGKGVVGIATSSAAGSTYGVFGQSASGFGIGVYGQAPWRGVHGLAPFQGGYFESTAAGLGVTGESSFVGVQGQATDTTGANFGGRFYSASSSGTGALGEATATSGTTYGLIGRAVSPGGRGVFGETPSTTGIVYGGYFQTDSDRGRGVLGFARSTVGPNFGGYFQSNGDSGRGVFASAASLTGATYGGYFQNFSSAGMGVYAEALSGSGTTFGVFGKTSSSANSSTGLYGEASAASGVTFGAMGRSFSTTGRGVYGWASAASGSTIGVLGQSDSPAGIGVYGLAPNAGVADTYGVIGRSDGGLGKGVYGYTSHPTGNAWGVYGLSESSHGVVGLSRHPNAHTSGGRFESFSNNGSGVEGLASATTGGAWGVDGETRSSASNAFGVIGFEPSGSPGHAVYASGSLAALGLKSFQIDHPLTPETRYLNHFCAEGPEPYNVYRGNVATDAKGYAVVNLPDYFESVNRDPTYHLTVIGSFAQAIVAEKIKGNRFVIRTDRPNIEVSWEVKAVRNDPYVRLYGYQTEQEKEDAVKGKYLAPELYGKPKEQGILYRPKPEPTNGAEGTR